MAATVRESIVSFDMSAERLKEIMAEMGMTGVEFANHVGFDRSTISLYAGGNRTIPKYAARLFELIAWEYAVGGES